LVIRLLDKVLQSLAPPFPPPPLPPRGGRGARLPYCCIILLSCFGFDCGTNLLMTFGKFSFSLPVTVSTSTYVTRRRRREFSFFQNVLTGPVQTKGLVNLPDFLPNFHTHHMSLSQKSRFKIIRGTIPKWGSEKFFCSWFQHMMPHGPQRATRDRLQLLL